MKIDSGISVPMVYLYFPVRTPSLAAPITSGWCACAANRSLTASRSCGATRDTPILSRPIRRKLARGDTAKLHENFIDIAAGRVAVE